MSYSEKDSLSRYGLLLADMAELNKINQLKQNMKTTAEGLIAKLNAGQPITTDEHIFLRSWINSQPKKRNLDSEGIK